MTAFAYRALTGAGEAVDGTVEAPTRDAAVARLRADGLLLLKVEPSGRFRLAASGRKEVAPAEAARLFEGLAVLLGAGVVLDRALDLLAASDDGATRRLARPLVDRVRSGTSLAGAMEAGARRFDPVSVALVRAGEEGGRLAEALEGLAAAINRSRAASERLRSALTYPLLILAAAVVTLVILTTVVVPAFAPLFANADAALPLSLAVLLAISDFTSAYGIPLAVAALVGVLVLNRILRRPAARRRADAFLLGLPRLGRLIACADLARFCRALAGLLEGGVPLASALPLARPALRNAELSSAVGTALLRVRSGGALAAALSEHPHVPPLVGHLLGIGEAGGRPARMLGKIADLCERDVERGLERLLAFLVPALTIGLGLVVGGVVAALMSAVLDVNQLAF